MEHRRYVSFLGAFVLLLGLFVVAGPDSIGAGEPRYFAIRNARIVPVAGPVMENGTVVIANGLIAAVGKDVAVPPEAWVIDGKGLTVYPGLIDALTDIGLPAAAPAPPVPGAPPAAAPATLQRISRGPEDRPGTTPWRAAADELKPDDRRIETWRNAGFTTALSAPRGGIFPGQGAVINLAGERPGEMVVKTPATLHIWFTPVGGLFSGFPGSLMGVISYVKQVLHDTAQYAAAQPIYEANPRGLERPDYDRTVRVINAALRSGRPVLLPGNTRTQIARAADLAAQFSLPAVIYGGQQGYSAADMLARKKIAVLVSLKWPEKEKDADPEARDPLRVLEFRDLAPSSPAALEKAGVKFAFYSDGITAPKDILKNAKKAIDAGLASDAALRALTLGAAEILGVANQLGSIEPGKVANLVVADGDLFNEKTKIKLVFVDGQKFEVREPARPTEKPAANLTGRWTLTVNAPEGPDPGTAELTMAEDGALSGSVTSKMGTASITTGWVSANRFSFTISMTMGPRTVDLTFTGTVEGHQMKGTVSFGPQSLEFTGTRPGTGGGVDAEQGGGR